MASELMIETIKAELEAADAATLRSIWQNLRQARQELAMLSEIANDKSSEFIGENPLFDLNRKISFKERASQKKQLKIQNRGWLLQKFKTLPAAWLMVVDGEIIASGKTLSDYPKPEQILAVCHRTGKLPFLFINEEVLAVEESSSVWQTTSEPHDYYPTVPVKLRSDSGEAAVIGDLDTGAIPTFVNYDFLVQQNVIQFEAYEDAELSRHLNQAYEYLPRSVVIEITLASGEVRSQETTIACVADWHDSPFVRINNHRIALVGREVFLKLKPSLLLNFENRQTEILSSAMINQANQNSSKKKKRAQRTRKTR